MSEDREDLVTAEEAIDNVEQDEIEQEFDGSETEQEVEEDSPDSEIVERAKKYGHLSKEEWVAAGKNPDLWKSPEEFNKTGEVIEQLYSLKKKVDQRDREIQALIEYQQRTAQREYEKARKELEARLASSKDDMDVEGVAHYTKELTRLEDMEQQSQAQQVQQIQKAAQESFIERNQHWFNDRNPDLKQRAIEIDNEIKADINAGRLKVNSLDEIAQMIEKRMSYEHPERVLGPQKVNRSIVSPSLSSVNKTAVNKNSSKKIFQGLPQELKDTYNAHRRIRASMGQELTEAEFIERLKADGEI